MAGAHILKQNDLLTLAMCRQSSTEWRRRDSSLTPFPNLLCDLDSPQPKGVPSLDFETRDSTNPSRHRIGSQLLLPGQTTHRPQPTRQDLGFSTVTTLPDMDRRLGVDTATSRAHLIDPRSFRQNPFQIRGEHAAKLGFDQRPGFGLRLRIESLHPLHNLDRNVGSQECPFR
jgi:hypothetical protein